MLLWIIIGLAAFLLWPTSLGGATTLIIVSGSSMEPTYSNGDLVIARTGEPQVGDVVVYEPEGLGGARVVHRIIGGDGVNGWQLQGDNNNWVDQWFPTNESVVGIVDLHLPNVGLFAKLLIAPGTWMFVIVLAIGLLMWPDSHARDDDWDDEEWDDTPRPAPVAGGPR